MSKIFEKLIFERKKNNEEINKIIEYIQSHSGEKIKLKTKNLFCPLNISVNKTIFLQIMKDLEYHNNKMIQEYIKLSNIE